MGIFSIFSLNEPFYVILIILIAYVLALVFSIVIHEVSHAFVALKMGDPTAKLSGRMSFSPIKHFDPVGMICLVLFGFGWAKPVPVNPNLFRNYKKGQILVSLSGVCTNLVLGVLFTFLSAVADVFFGSSVIALFVRYLFAYLAITNYVLAIFNLLPIYPLDGFSFLEAFLPYENKFMQFMRQYGIIIMLVLLVSTAIPRLMNLLVGVFYNDLWSVFTHFFV